MLNFGVRRFITQQSNGVLVSANFVATSSNFLLMDQENDKETKKDFRKIVKMLERSPSKKREKQQKQTDDSEKWGIVGRDDHNLKEFISKSLHKDYDDYALRKSIESWKRRARRETFCYMRDQNTLGLIGYTHRYIEQLIEMNGKNNQRTFEDNELVVVVLKFVLNKLLNGNGAHPTRNEQMEKTPK